jgi:hypothetical protein
MLIFSMGFAAPIPARRAMNDGEPKVAGITFGRDSLARTFLRHRGWNLVAPSDSFCNVNLPRIQRIQPIHPSPLAIPHFTIRQVAPVSTFPYGE